MCIQHRIQIGRRSGPIRPGCPDLDSDCVIPGEARTPRSHERLLSVSPPDPRSLCCGAETSGCLGAVRIGTAVQRTAGTCRDLLGIHPGVRRPRRELSFRRAGLRSIPQVLSRQGTDAGRRSAIGGNGVACRGRGWSRHQRGWPASALKNGWSRLDEWSTPRKRSIARRPWVFPCVSSSCAIAAATIRSFLTERAVVSSTPIGIVHCHAPCRSLE